MTMSPDFSSITMLLTSKDKNPKFINNPILQLANNNFNSIRTMDSNIDLHPSLCCLTLNTSLLRDKSNQIKSLATRSTTMYIWIGYFKDALNALGEEYRNVCQAKLKWMNKMKPEQDMGE